VKFGISPSAMCEVECNIKEEPVSYSILKYLLAKYCDLETQVRGHSRSLETTPFDRLYI